ncbi:unnamed protein product [marine sediment metagenome]|uniref:Amidohydrolase 3 domain-containing protein n=1 Tax=marine sediment metagenome TaxID=412755 RepID=X1N9Z9_9ZZZZ
MSLEDAVKLFSANPATFYKLNQKGEIKVGKDADLVLLDKEYILIDSFAMGRITMVNGKIIAKGTFT